MSFSPDAIVWLIVFVISLTAHEGAHALAAYWGGDKTAYNAGQVSLSPLPHIRREPFGMVLMPLLTVFTWGWPMGWASTPYDPRWAQRYPRRAAWMAAAGPGANFALAALALLGMKAGLAAGVFSAPDQVTFVRMVVAADPFLDNAGRFLSMLLFLNTMLGLFNLIPFPPLDGASVITLAFSDDMALRFKEVLHQPGVGIVGLMAAWWLFPEVIRPVWSVLLLLVHPDVPYS